MHRIVCDTAKNRLFITISGVIDPQEAEAISSRIIQDVARLRPGFDVINNLTYYKSMSSILASAPLKRVLRIFAEEGVHRIIRVVGGSKTAIMHFAQATLGFHKESNVIYVPTMEDAEKKLSEFCRIHLTANKCPTCASTLQPAKKTPANA